jgi:plasmid maintenance system antidote protein VapI
MFNFLIAGIGALASYNAQKRAAKAQEAAYQRQLEQDRKNRQLAKQDAANKFVDLGKAADKAGINRLTALRATGGAGFGMYGGYTAQVPVISRANFIETFGGSMLKTWATNKINEPIDAYNKQIRKLELEQRQLDIKLSRKQINNIGKTDAMYQNLQKQIQDLYEKSKAPEARAAINQNEVVSDKAPTVKETVIGPQGGNTNVYAGDDISEMVTSWLKGQLVKGKIARIATEREQRLNPVPINRGGFQMPPFVPPESYGQLSRAITVTRYNNARMNEVIHGGNAY